MNLLRNRQCSAMHNILSSPFIVCPIIIDINNINFNILLSIVIFDSLNQGRERKYIYRLCLFIVYKSNIKPLNIYMFNQFFTDIINFCYLI